MKKHEIGVGIYLAYRRQCEYVIGAFQDPTPSSVSMLQMAQKPLVKAISRTVPSAIDPFAIGRDVVGRIETIAREQMSGDFGAFLRRVGAQVVNSGKLRRHSRKAGQLPRDSVASALRMLRRRVYRFPATHHRVRFVLRQHVMKKGRAASRHSADENRLIDRFGGNGRRRPLRFLELEQISEKPQSVPPRYKPAECAEVRLILEAAQKNLERRFEAPLAEIRQSRLPLRQAHQFWRG